MVSGPDWVIAEVTGEPRYYNVNLAANPFNQWEDDEAAGQDSRNLQKRPFPAATTRLAIQ